MISKDIFSIWFDEEGKMPELVRHCLETQKIDGYTHRLITLEDLPTDNKYVKECLESAHRPAIKWCKLSDYMRAYTLFNDGGIYLDADVEVLPNRDFDNLLDNEMFAGLYRQGNIGSTVLASIPNEEFYKDWLEYVETNFRGDDDCIPQTSYEYLTAHAKGVFTLYPSEYFYPYDHKYHKLEITDNTVSIHYFMRSWA